MWIYQKMRDNQGYLNTAIDITLHNNCYHRGVRLCFSLLTRVLSEDFVISLPFHHLDSDVKIEGSIFRFHPP